VARSWICYPVLLLASLVACTSTATPPPTLPPIQRLAVTPALEGLVTTWLLDYRATAGPPAFDLEVMPLESALGAAASGQVDAVLAAASPPDGWFATPLAKEPIAVIVHRSNPVTSLTLQDLAGIFTGRITRWETWGGAALEIEPVIPLRGDELRSAFASLVLQEARFTGAALLGPSPELVVRLVSERPGAVGFVIQSSASSQVKVLSVQEGSTSTPSPTDLQHPLAVEILAMAPEEPGGPIREWLGWLQAKLQLERR